MAGIVSLVIALDVGGTNIRGELVDREGTVHAAAHELTAGSDGDATLDAIERVCRTLLAAAADGRVVDAVGLAVPGVVDSRTGVVLLAGNLGWRDLAVSDVLGQRLGLPVLLHHDVNCAGLAERELGAGRGVDDLLAIFIGTGIAASLTVGGVTLGGGVNQAGELGHVVIREGGLACPCGQTGCLERYCSASSIGLAYAAATGRDGMTSLDVVTALGDDPRADAVWADAIAALATGILGAITLLGTQRVVIGGGLAAAGDALVVPLRTQLEATVKVATIPEIVVAELGQRAGVIGAALATWKRLAAH
ncbi:ROK family protein [Sanguibacter sp. A247]|uniref:ROK family protein n=1 Tax=unclassified Sanguibacter TaxID=2645534 RepID=UPI003FD842F8